VKLKFSKPDYTFLYPAGLIAVALALAFLNYQPGSWLSGWDNLHPEFDFKLNIGRSLWVAWQEYQGLGLLAGMAHAADLPRQFILWLASLFFPTPFLRYFWTFSMLVLGPVGCFYLSRDSLLTKFSATTKNFAAFFSGLFYLLNLSTIQAFYTPYSAFTTMFAALPWLIWGLIRFYRRPRLSWALGLGGLLFLASPAFHVQTNFLVFLVVYGFVSLQYLLSSGRLKFFHRAEIFLIGLLTLLATQAYWLLPNAYFSLTSASTTVAAAQNQVATREIALRNQEFGNLGSVALLKGFWFEYVDLGENNQFGYMMAPWRDHLSNQAVNTVGWLLFLIVLAGVYYSLRRKMSYGLAFALSLFVGLFFLINNNPPTGWLFSTLAEQLPLFGQLFRSVFSKWSLPVSLGYSLFFSVGIVFLLDIFTFLEPKYTSLVTGFSLTLALLLLTAPAFAGHLIYSPLRTAIPPSYFELFEYMQQQEPATRIANFPQHTFWGWGFYDWGYRGSGFIWYGLPQAVLDRAFDVWSPYSEDYYQEVQRAVYSRDLGQVEAVLEKYSASWILLDRSLQIPGTQDQSGLYLDQITSMLEASEKIHLEKTFDNLSLYRVELAAKPLRYIDTGLYEAAPTTPPPLATTKLSLLETPLNNRSQIELKNCDQFNQTLFEKEITSTEVKYKAIDANSCDHFLYPELSHANAYQIDITHRNISGSPFFVCLESYTSGQCHIYQYLPASNDWITTRLYLPPLNSADSGFTLHLLNYSIGQTPTENWWSQINLTSVTPQSEPEVSNPNLPPSLVKQVRKFGTGLYAISLTPSAETSQLVLNQAFDSGWKAYAPADTSGGLLSLLANTQTKLPLPESRHSRAKGWANGWTISPNTDGVIIFYQPQLLQYLGFSFILLWLILLLLIY
jgi:hypothetical protein